MQNFWDTLSEAESEGKLKNKDEPDDLEEFVEPSEPTVKIWTSSRNKWRIFWKIILTMLVLDAYFAATYLIMLFIGNAIQQRVLAVNSASTLFETPIVCLDYLSQVALKTNITLEYSTNKASVANNCIVSIRTAYEDILQVIYSILIYRKI